MTRMVLDDAVLSKLTNSRDMIEICDSQGRLRGVFQALQPGEAISLEPEIPEEEMERRAHLPINGRKLSDIMADWEKRS